MQSEMRYCQDIGMFAIDRPKHTCKHATAFCRANCYNNKLYNIYTSMEGKDLRNEQYFQGLTGEGLKVELSRKQLQTKRFRFMTRGEAFRNIDDVYHVASLVKSNPDTLFWIPTRAWRNAFLRANIESIFASIKNARIQASVDPSNTPEEIGGLLADNWSLMGFGWKTKVDMENHFAITGAQNCPKTHDHKTGACATCKGRCFSPKTTVVFLDKH